MFTISIDPIIFSIGHFTIRWYSLLDHWSHGFSANPLRALSIWEGGLAAVAFAPSHRRRASVAGAAGQSGRGGDRYHPAEGGLADVVRCVEMFLMTDAPVSGVVENMSSLVCPDCGKRMEVFRKGGSEWLARRFNLPLLGQIPLEPDLREGGDLGQPVRKAESSAWQAFRQLAGEVAGQVSVRRHKSDSISL